MAKHENAQLLSIKLSIVIGYDLNRSSPELARAYASEYSHAALAEELRKKKEFAQYGQTVMEHAVRFSLVGNDDSKLGPVYEGSMSVETYAIHSKRHRATACRSNGILSSRERRGIHGLDSKKLSELGVKAAIARGQTPWSREELSQVLSMGLVAMFKVNGLIDYGSIAENLNRKFYDGKPVRDNVSTREALRRLQRSFKKKQID